MRPWHVAICWEPCQATAALALATDLRRFGVMVDYALSGKAKRQFERAKRGGAIEIITVRNDDCRVWRRASRSLDASSSDVSAYYRWLMDDYDEAPEPPEHMYEARGDV